MPKKESVNINIINGDEPNSKVYIMSLNIRELDIYNKAKATKRFINSETKVLEMLLETHLREILRSNGIIPLDGSEDALNKAFLQLELKGKKIEIADRYYEINGEKIIGESENHMTVIEEDGVLSCAIEVSVREEKE